MAIINTLYTKKACGPCNELKWWVDKMKAVVHETIDVTNWDASQLADLDLRSVPSIVVDNGRTILAGTKALQWVKSA